MAFNASSYDMEEYRLKWLKVLGYIGRTWVEVLWMSFMCYFNCLLFWVLFANCKLSKLEARNPRSWCFAVLGFLGFLD